MPSASFFDREVPPLRHATVHRLKREFPALTIVLNGGVAGDGAIAEPLCTMWMA